MNIDNHYINKSNLDYLDFSKKAESLIKKPNYFENSVEDERILNLRKCEEIANQLKELDESLFLNRKELTKKYNTKVYVWNKESRIIITPFGEVKFQRRSYFYIDQYNKKIWFYLLDDYINLEKYKRFDTNYKNRIFNKIKNDKVYSLEQLSKVNYRNCCKATVHNFLKGKVLNEEFDNQEKLVLDPSKNLYVNIDDTYVYFKNKD
ncbi:conserved hypothetical protein [Malacoplasma penetrans HF-2]|uniref:Uncharacterized protein n=1 Tax=Malacoplasma penetrans (strain HF-2) TaxID=272633 RepID=Q8EVN0_MALP2|nr:UPF0236 family protein [Malacoplasma penetrans]BAC44321.1 conserved hypothetical protein [Malacoplasma penetrans HF-2]